jgi:hypothetical protein
MSFTAHAVRLGQLFADPFFVEAPAFQRAYAWTSREAGRLLDDVAAALEGEAQNGDGADYFLGAMLFIDPNRPAQSSPTLSFGGPARTFEVVDGLQRLTTLTILFCVLRDLDEEEGVAPHAPLLDAICAGRDANLRFRLSLRGAGGDFFIAHIAAPAAGRSALSDGPLTPAEERLIEVREHFFSALSDQGWTQRRQLADFLLLRCHAVLVATNDIDRAHRMFMVLNDTGKPLARNDILKAELLSVVPAGQQAAVTRAWDDIEAKLGREFEGLFSHVRTMYGRPGGQVIAGIRAIAAEYGGSAPFFDQVLCPAAAVLHDILHARHAGSPHSATISANLRYLAWLPAADWVPCAMLWWLKAGENAAELASFLASLDRLAYGLRIMGLGANRRLQRFGALLSAIRSGSDLKAPTSPLTLYSEELRTINYNLRDLHLRSPPTAKLVLLRLNDRMARTPQILANDEFTVEHVLPRKVGANSQWRSWFPLPEERERCTHSIGNLVLVTKAQNDKASNLEFSRKQTVYFQTAGAPLPALNDPLRPQTEWRAAQIAEREADLLHVLQAMWDFGGDVTGRNAARGGRRSRARVA